MAEGKCEIAGCLGLASAAVQPDGSDQEIKVCLSHARGFAEGRTDSADIADTLVYPGHNYTEENYEFALTIEPGNKLVTKSLQAIKEWQNIGKPTVPSNIDRERATNVFLRADDPEIKSALGMPTATPAEVFAELRLRKNAFG